MCDHLIYLLKDRSSNRSDTGSIGIPRSLLSILIRKSSFHLSIPLLSVSSPEVGSVICDPVLMVGYKSSRWSLVLPFDNDSLSLCFLMLLTAGLLLRYGSDWSIPLNSIVFKPHNVNMFIATVHPIRKAYGSQGLKVSLESS